MCKKNNDAQEDQGLTFVFVNQLLKGFWRTFSHCDQSVSVQFFIRGQKIQLLLHFPSGTHRIQTLYDFWHIFVLSDMVAMCMLRPLCCHGLIVSLSDKAWALTSSERFASKASNSPCCFDFYVLFVNDNKSRGNAPSASTDRIVEDTRACRVINIHSKVSSLLIRSAWKTGALRLVLMPKMFGQRLWCVSCRTRQN